ncbi:MAG TPA: pyruvate kinase [Kouleothrix sp.]|uniref:pyruvate kinase n=1 Tax=Kouleothrix sp. TaxID=2779161 RepID=UPI002CE13912|nr:pyruvate kinase [Kouleothrix sp.]HRC76483.1 pyruvate kinase [Kouleothrix sp.]
MRRTKIVATIGPASGSPETIAQLIAAGMDVARLNFSHGSHAEHAQRIEMLREAARQADRPLAVLQDLQGPKIRTGKLENGVPVLLHPGDRFDITVHEIAGTAARVSTTYTALPLDVQPGDRILLSDGLIELRVVETTADEVHTSVVFGGELRENQGINLPGVNVSAPALTEKDIADLEFGLAHNVDYVAISFVRRAADLRDVKERISAAGKNTPVIAKIEKPEALSDLSAILEIADGIMVARGDLGVEMAAEQVPVVQKQLIEAANLVGIPVITATQMLDSMIRNPRPTRAEASDVANAIIDGTDAVMLSGETANGQFPIESVRMMARIAEVAEASGRHGDHTATPTITIDRQPTVSQAISAAACAIVKALPVSAIAAFTMSGTTARLVAQMRPLTPILAFTPAEAVYHRLNLVWGITPIMCDYVDRLDSLGARVNEMLLKRGFVQPGDSIVMTGGHPIAARGATNFVKVLPITE